ncbi:MAG: translocation/assembly module TamB domain-containing protein [bacterium]|nr:translocation/assembly module TamB domain-containing protein [bacterium]
MKRRILAFFIVLILTGITVGMKVTSSPALDQWLRESIVEQAAKHLGVNVELGKLDRNFLLTRITLTDVTLRDLKGSGKSISMSRLVVVIDPYAFFRGKVVIKDLKLEDMSLEIVRHADGTVAVDPLFPFWQAQPRTRSRSPRLGFEIENIAFTDVDLSYEDIQAGVQLKLGKVLIFLVHNRFDPPDRRTINLRAKEGDIAWRVFPQDRTVTINSLSGVFSVTPEELHVSKFRIDTGPINLELSGTLPFRRGASVNGELSVSMDIGKLPWLIPDSAGRITLNGNVGGDLSSPSFRGQLDGVDVRVTGRATDRLNADIFMDPKGCTLREGKVYYRGEELLSEVDLSFKRFLPFAMRLRTKQYPFHKVLKEVGGKTDFTNGYVSADLIVKGQLSGGASAITMEGALGVPVSGSVLRTMDFDLSGRYQKGSLQDLLLNVRSGGMDLNLEGTLSGDGPLLKLSLVDEDLVNWHTVPGLEELSGSLALSGIVKGGWENVEANLDLEYLKPSWNRFMGDLLQGHVDIDRSGLTLPMLTLKAGSCVLVGQASLPWNLAGEKPWVKVSVTDGQVEDLLSAAGVDFEIRGKLGGDLHASFTGSGWEGGGALTLLSGRILAEPFEEIYLAGNFTEDVFTTDRLSILKDGRRLEGSGSIEGGEYRVKVRTLDPILVAGVEYVKIIRVPLGGEISFSGEASGNLDGSRLRARTDLAWDQITYDGRTWRSGKGTFLFNGPKLEAKADLFDGELSAVASVDLRGEFPFSGSIFTPATIDQMGINDFIGVGIPGNIVSGDISVRANASGILANVNKTYVDGIITDADFTINGIHFISQEQIPFDYFPETGIRFMKLLLRSGESVISGILRIAPDAGIEGSVDGSIDLAGLTFLEPTVDSFSGQAITQLKVAGSLTEPVLNGSIELLGNQCVAHLPFDLPVSDLKGKLEIVGNRLHIGEILGNAEGGSLLMSGELFMSGFKPVQGSLLWKAEDIPIQYPEGLNTVNRADLGLKFSDGRGFLRGTINMDQGAYTREVDIENLLTLIGEGTITRDEPQVEGSEGANGKWLNLDVEMVTASPLLVDIKLIRGEAAGNLHLRGTAAAPVLTGRFEMTEGSLEYRGHVFEITGGSVGFVNPRRIEPDFNFSGRTEVTGFDREGTVTDYTVELLASGVPEKFELDLVSSPVLSEADIAALLTWGAVGEQAFASRGGLSAAEATLLITRELKGKLETEVEKVTGFDRFTINPSSVSSSGERTTRIQVDKKLSEKIYLTYSTPILASEEQEVLVKYRITKSFSLIGEQLGERDYGLDLDFQFEID